MSEGDEMPTTAPAGPAPFSMFGNFEARRGHFRTIKRMLDCQFPGCTEQFPYYHGKPGKWCPTHRSSHGITAREAHHARKQDAVRGTLPAAPAPVSDPVAAVVEAPTVDARKVAFRASQLTDRQLVAFLRTEGVVSLPFKLGHKIIIRDRVYEGDTMELAVAAAIEAERAA